MKKVGIDDYYDWYEYYWRDFEATEEDTLKYLFQNLVLEVCNPSSNFQSGVFGELELYLPVNPTDQIDLLDYCELIHSVSLEESYLEIIDLIQNSIDCQHSIDVIKAESDKIGPHFFFIKVCLFAPFWINSPSTWKPESGSLISHLFEIYEAPEALESEWYKK